MVEHPPRTAFYALAVAAVLAAPPAFAAGGEAPYFADVAAEVGIDFVHVNGRSGAFYFPEMTGQGGALLDIDGDGDLDLYLLQGGVLGPGKTAGDLLDPPPPGAPAGDRLYRNDLTVTAGGGRRQRFVDVTARSGIDGGGYGMAAATGDVDGDGRSDLYVANHGGNRLWRNNGDGTFTDLTAPSATDDPLWSTAATFFDAEGDGDLDLYVVNYVHFDLAANPRCYAPSSRRDYCGPSGFAAQDDRLLLNRGRGADGTVRFETVTRQALLGYRPGKGLGVVSADFDGDGRADLYVANDGEPNQLWLNQGPGADGDPTFRDQALLAGVAVNRRGEPEASMGVTAGDFDGDGDPDLFMTHLAGETNTLYVNAGGGLFDDRSAESGLGPPSLPFTGFGTGWLDLDNDGWLDLVVVNGAVRIEEPLAQAGDSYPLDQRNQLFKSRGPDGRGRITFEDVTAHAGAAFDDAEVSRGAVLGDLDDDGDTDLVVLNNNGRARVLRNLRGQDAAWLGLRLLGAQGGDALGAEATLVLAGGRSLVRRAHSDGSYASAGDPRLLFGLGAGGAPTALRVRWPDGTVERFQLPPAGAYATLQRGGGMAPPPASEATADP